MFLLNHCYLIIHVYTIYTLNALQIFYLIGGNIMNTKNQDHEDAKLVRSKTRTMLVLAQSLGIGDHAQLTIAAINNELQKLIPDYCPDQGWCYFELPEGGFFIVPKNQFDSNSIEKGITATLIALYKLNKHSLIEIDKLKIKKSYLLLVEHVAALPNAKKLLKAIDYGTQ